MAYYECNNQLNNAIIEDVNYPLTASDTTIYLDLANYKELIMIGVWYTLPNVTDAKHALIYDLTDDSIFNKLIRTLCVFPNGVSTYVYTTLGVTKTFLNTKIFQASHNNLFTIFKIILI